MDFEVSRAHHHVELGDHFYTQLPDVPQAAVCRTACEHFVIARMTVKLHQALELHEFGRRMCFPLRNTEGTRGVSLVGQTTRKHTTCSVYREVAAMFKLQATWGPNYGSQTIGNNPSSPTETQTIGVQGSKV